jgi:hypothetical protein
LIFMKKTCLAIFACFSLSVQAQDNCISSGGEAIGLGGSASYSVGQLVYHAIPNQNYSVQEGLQQPIEVFVLSVPKIPDNYPMIKAYPNPVTSTLTLQFDYVPENSSFELIDSAGRVVEKDPINNQATTISMERFRVGIYILHVSTKNRKSVHSFKILKN